jgi:hypothetical protein
MMSPWESALSSLNPKYWVAGYQVNRYGLEKIGIAGVLPSYAKAYIQGGRGPGFDSPQNGSLRGFLVMVVNSVFEPRSVLERDNSAGF